MQVMCDPTDTCWLSQLQTRPVHPLLRAANSRRTGNQRGTRRKLESKNREARRGLRSARLEAASDTGRRERHQQILVARPRQQARRARCQALPRLEHRTERLLDLLMSRKRCAWRVKRPRVHPTVAETGRWQRIQRLMNRTLELESGCGGSSGVTWLARLFIFPRHVSNPRVTVQVMSN